MAPDLRCKNSKLWSSHNNTCCHSFIIHTPLHTYTLRERVWSDSQRCLVLLHPFPNKHSLPFSSVKMTVFTHKMGVTKTAALKYIITLPSSLACQSINQSCSFCSAFWPTIPVLLWRLWAVTADFYCLTSYYCQPHVYDLICMSCALDCLCPVCVHMYAPCGWSCGPIYIL